MCGCSEKEINLKSIKIYTFMGTYKAKLNSGVSVKNGFIIEWAAASQEVLAHAYEELGMTDVIEKLSTTKTKDEPKKATKKKESGKESSDSKE
jgi:hypothetical protein|tara:strand:+ start:176 stop:454 length:279 start_codon:yes stop_codon:yes gene_type:complete